METNDKNIMSFKDITTELGRVSYLQKKNKEIINKFSSRIEKINNNISDADIEELQKYGIDISFIRHIDASRLNKDKDYLSQIKKTIEESSLTYRKIMTQYLADEDI